jgi:hypothetical protein
LSSSTSSVAPECPKKSSPSSFHKSRICFPFPSSGRAGRLPACFADKSLEASRFASWSSFSSSCTISLGFVTSVKFLFPTTKSCTCK